jgi:hypothetical protein
MRAFGRRGRVPGTLGTPVTPRTSVLVARARRSAETLALAAILLLTIVLSAPAVAAAPRPRDQAGDAQSRVDAARRAANVTAGRYLSALGDFERLKTQVTQTEGAIADAERRAAVLKEIVQRRAARAYKSAGSNLPSVLKVTDLADAMRTDKLLASANVKDSQAMSLLRSQQEDLKVNREALRGLESRQAGALADLQRTARRADAQLAAALRDRADVQARLAAQAAAAAATRSTSRSGSSGRPTAAAPSRPAPPRPAAPPPPSSGMSPHHNDPFLACVRHRESRGNYGVINPSGPWYGAYQFLASTWNVTARHAGRLDLVGVLPSDASAYDQDEMAWALYQWQGSGPWGGAC